MQIINQFIKEYKLESASFIPKFPTSLKGLIEETKYITTGQNYSPSSELIDIYKNLLTREKEPVSIALLGRHTSGKSALLNSILQAPIIPPSKQNIKPFIIKYSNTDYTRVFYRDGASIVYDINMLDSLNQDEFKKIDHFEILLHSEILKDMSIYSRTLDEKIKSANEMKRQISHFEKNGLVIWIMSIKDIDDKKECEMLKGIFKNQKNIMLLLNYTDSSYSQDAVNSAVKNAKDIFGKIFSDILPISSIKISEFYKIEQKRALKNEIEKLYKNYIQIDDPQKMDRIFDHTKEALKSEFSEQANVEKIDVERFENLLFHLKKELLSLSSKIKNKNIKEELSVTVHRIRDDYSNIKKRYANLTELLGNQCECLIERIDEIKSRVDIECEEFFKSLESERDEIINSILSNTREITLKTVPKNRKMIDKLRGVKVAKYKTFEIDSATIYQELLYAESRATRKFRALTYKFDKLKKTAITNLEKSFSEFSYNIKIWQNQNDTIPSANLLAGHMAIDSIELYSAKIYENIIYDFSEAVRDCINTIDINFSKTHQMLISTRDLVVKHTVSMLRQRLNNEARESLINGSKSATMPNKEELESILNGVFYIELYKREIIGEYGDGLEIFDITKNYIKDLGIKKRGSIENIMYDFSYRDFELNELLQKIDSFEE